jgi:GAF domain-containing protein
VVIRDTHADARVDAALRASFDAVGLRATVSVPIRTKSGAAVVLGLHSARLRAWTESEIARIEETAMRTANAVERGRSRRSPSRTRISSRPSRAQWTSGNP